MIEIKQHTGRSPRTGKTVAHSFDNVYWKDGDHLRHVAIVGHEENSPIQYYVRVPEATRKEIREAVEKRKAERANERSDAASGTGRAGSRGSGRKGAGATQ